MSTYARGNWDLLGQDYSEALMSDREPRVNLRDALAAVEHDAERTAEARIYGDRAWMGVH